MFLFVILFAPVLLAGLTVWDGLFNLSSIDFDLDWLKPKIKILIGCYCVPLAFVVSAFPDAYDQNSWLYLAIVTLICGTLGFASIVFGLADLLQNKN